MESSRDEAGDHRVINVGVQTTITSKGDNDFRFKQPDSLDEQLRNFSEISAL
jgi:hypothetical protein